jgi:hypothetical protein
VEEDTSAPGTRVTADAVRLETVVVAPFATVPILALILIWVFAGSRRRSLRIRKKSKEERREPRHEK